MNSQNLKTYNWNDSSNHLLYFNQKSGCSLAQMWATAKREFRLLLLPREIQNIGLKVRP
jgi:hypothetical protein